MNYKNLGSIFSVAFSIAMLVGYMSFNSLPTFASGSHFDNSFNNNGRSVISFTNLNFKSVAHDVAIQTDGKIIVAGIDDNVAGQAGFAIARYNPNGSLDSTFSDDGKLLLTLGESAAIAIQSDGKIIIAGTGDLQGLKLPVLYRLNQDGSPDTTFGNNGLGRIVDNQNSMRVLDVAVQADGKIVIVGSFHTYSNWRMVRYNADSSRDSSFGNGTGNNIGIVETDFGGDTNEVARAVSILPNGRIVVAPEQAVADRILHLHAICKMVLSMANSVSMAKLQRILTGQMISVTI